MNLSERASRKESGYIVQGTQRLDQSGIKPIARNVGLMIAKADRQSSQRALLRRREIIPVSFESWDKTKSLLILSLHPIRVKLLGGGRYSLFGRLGPDGILALELLPEIHLSLF